MRKSIVDLGEDLEHTPFGLSWRSHPLFIISTAVIGLFSESFLNGLIIPLLPFILQDRVGVAHEDLQRYSAALLFAYAISSVACCLLAGAISDRSSSRKAPWMYGLALSIGVCFPISISQARIRLTEAGVDIILHRPFRPSTDIREMYARCGLRLHLGCGVRSVF